MCVLTYMFDISNQISCLPVVRMYVRFYVPAHIFPGKYFEAIERAQFQINWLHFHMHISVEPASGQVVRNVICVASAMAKMAKPSVNRLQAIGDISCPFGCASYIGLKKYT